MLRRKKQSKNAALMVTEEVSSIYSERLGTTEITLVTETRCDKERNPTERHF